MNRIEISALLNSHGLKTTPQRIAVYESLLKLDHPYAENVLKEVHKHHPGIAKGTVYNILESFITKGIIRKVKTDRDRMRYDAVLISHHHLYDENSDQILDYQDEDLDRLLDEYFTSHQLPGFDIREIKLQIIGNISKLNIKK